jgi:hypothetical protein
MTNIESLKWEPAYSSCAFRNILLNKQCVTSAWMYGFGRLPVFSNQRVNLRHLAITYVSSEHTASIFSFEGNRGKNYLRYAGSLSLGIMGGNWDRARSRTIWVVNSNEIGTIICMSHTTNIFYYYTVLHNLIWSMIWHELSSNPTNGNFWPHLTF